MSATPATKITTQDLFETRPCNRCGGSGHYSYNTMHGSICYGCSGKGYQFTKAGQAAKDAWKAGWTFNVAVRDLEPGEKVIVRDSMRNRESVHTVESSGPDDLNPGRWMVRFSAGTLGGFGFCNGDAQLRRPATGEQKRAAYEAIAHMPGAKGWPA